MRGERKGRLYFYVQSLKPAFFIYESTVYSGPLQTSFISHFLLSVLPTLLTTVKRGGQHFCPETHLASPFVLSMFVSVMLCPEVKISFHRSCSLHSNYLRWILLCLKWRKISFNSYVKAKKNRPKSNTRKKMGFFKSSSSRTVFVTCR